MELIDSLKSANEDVYKLIYKDSSYDPVMEVAYLRKGDGKDIIVVPTQTNCNMGCKFCHLTGTNAITENISASNIVKLVIAALDFQRPSNPTLLISYMGAGEPLMNVEGVINSALDMRVWGSPVSCAAYKKVRFGVSTLIPGEKPFRNLMEQVVEHKLPMKLHWSLHSVRSLVRKSLMPSALVAKTGMNLVNEYAETTKQPVEIHYTLIDGVNDQQEDIDGLLELVNTNVPIKLLRFSPYKNEPTLFESNRVSWFKDTLERNGYTIEVYCSPGRDINASCGQFIGNQYAKISNG